MKILVFHHDAGPQALVQFRTSEEAKAVKESLEKEELQIENRLITFEIQYSKFPDLRVSQNNKASWDFTVAPLPEPETPSLAVSSPLSQESEKLTPVSPAPSGPVGPRPKRSDDLDDLAGSFSANAAFEPSDSLRELLNTPSLKPYRYVRPEPSPVNSLLGSHRWSSSSLQEYANNNYMNPTSSRSQFATLDSYNASGRSRAFSFNGRNSGGGSNRLSSPDLRVVLLTRCDSRVWTVLVPSRSQDRTLITITVVIVVS